MRSRGGAFRFPRGQLCVNSKLLNIQSLRHTSDSLYSTMKRRRKSAQKRRQNRTFEGLTAKSMSNNLHSAFPLETFSARTCSPLCSFLLRGTTPRAYQNANATEKPLVIGPSKRVKTVSSSIDSPAECLLESMVWLALGLSGDFSVVCRKVTRSEPFALASAIVLRTIFYGLWFGYTAWKKSTV